MWQTLQKQKIQKQVNFIVKLKIKKMNKKLFLGMFAAAGMLFATSCSNDELDIVQSGNEAQVSFSLGLEGGIATRAISDGTGAKKLVCAVYDVNYKLLRQSVINGSVVNNDGQFVDTEAFENNLKDQVTVTLAKGQTYTMVFWAQNKDCDAYTTTDLTDVSISYDGLNNDENRDAFFAAETFKVTGNAEINVTLKRPFAQINVGVTEYDWNAAVGSGVEIMTSKVVIKNAANKINLLDGSVDGEVVVEYDFAKIPQQFDTPETLDVDTDGDGVKESYKYLSMSYILVNDENGGSSKATLESEGLQFTFSPEAGNNILFFEGLNNVPVQRNWRTNILGKILTGDVQFNITIDPIYDGEYNYPEYKENKIGLNGTYYATIVEALNVANDGDVIYVGEDTYKQLPTITKKVTLNCEEGTVFEGTQSFNIAGSTIVGATFKGNNGLVMNSSTVNGTFKNCTFNGDLKYGYAGETVVFENCEFNGPDYAIHFDGNASGATDTKVILKNCEINSNWRVAIGAAISMFEATDCKFNVKGFINMWGKATLTNCEFNKPEHWICNIDYSEYWNCKYDGRALTANDLRIEASLIKVNGEYYASSVDGLNKAITAGATTINLAAGEYNCNSDGIKAEGKTLTLTGTEDAVLNLYNVGENGANYSFKGSNVTFDGLTINTNANTGSYKGFAYMKGTFNNCNFIGGGFTTYDNCSFNNCTIGLDGYVWTWGASAVTFEGCTFTGDSRSILAHGSASTVIDIKNCNFAATEKGYTGSGDWTACVEIDPTANNTYTININGSTKNDNYSDWARIKDGSTGHSINGVE